MVYQTEKQLKELGDKVPAPVKEKVDAKLQELKDVISGGSTQSMKDAMAALNQEVLQIGQAMYNQPGADAAGPASGAEAGPTPGAGPTSSGRNRPSDGDVIDADFTESNYELMMGGPVRRIHQWHQ
jgi:heat shock 70kDa protein 1/2/6/8